MPESVQARLDPNKTLMSIEQVVITQDPHGDSAREQEMAVFGGRRVKEIVPSESGAGEVLDKRLSGTLVGVFFPCCQNMFGIIAFLRLPWVVGQAGIIGACAMLSISFCVAFCTALSMSAIATNGKVQGGNYYMLSRCLGPDFGGAIGILYFLGAVFGCAMYILGAAEAFTGFFPEVTTNTSFDVQVVGLTVIVVLIICVTRGIRRVGAIGTLFLIPVFIGILCAVIGSFTLGTPASTYPVSEGARQGWGSTGWSLQHLKDNAWPQFTENWNFGSVLAILFPIVTGFEAGSDRSSVLRTPSHSIPLGSLWATAVCASIFYSIIFIFGCTFSRAELQANYYVMPLVAWPHPMVVKVSIIVGSMGAGLCTMATAPLILMAVAKDFKDSIPFMSRFALANPGDEPRAAIFFAVFLVTALVLLGDLNYVAPLITQFLVLAYIFINVACILMVVLKSPSWRPTFKYHSKYISMLGVVAAVYIIFADSANWFVPIITVTLFMSLYVWIRTKNIENDGSDGLKGLKTVAALDNLVNLSYCKQSVKNWRPNFMLMQKMTADKVSKNDESLDEPLLQVAKALSMGKGAPQIIACLEFNEGQERSKSWLDVEAGNKMYKLAEAATELMREQIVKGHHRAIGRGICWHDINDAAVIAIQSAGLGVLTPNCVAMRYPTYWQDQRDDRKFFVTCLSSCFQFEKAALVCKGLNTFPMAGDALTGSIDVWWQREDGGLMLLFASMLKTSAIWKRCKVRLFTFSYASENSLAIKKQCEAYLNRIRIKAKVFVIEFNDDIFDDQDTTRVRQEAVNRTIQMDQRDRHRQQLQSTFDRDLGSRETEEEEEGGKHGGLLASLINPDPTASGFPEARDRLLSDVKEDQDSSPQLKAAEHPRIELPRRPLEPPGDAAASFKSLFEAPTAAELSPDSPPSPGPLPPRALPPSWPTAWATHEAREERGERGELAPEEQGSAGQEKGPFPAPPPLPDPAPPLESLSEVASEAEKEFYRDASTHPAGNSNGHQAGKSNLKKSKSDPSRISCLGKDGEAGRTKLMQSALHYNKYFRKHSGTRSKCRIVLMNLPQPALYPSPSHFLSFVDALTQRLERVLLVRGTGNEVVTSFL